MLRKICFGLMGITALFSANTYAVDSQPLSQSVTVEYELPANQPQTFINYMFWAIDASCIIHTEDESDEFFVRALAKKGKINDKPMVAGESLFVTVHPGESLRLSADSGAKVEITNYGEHTVKATCTA